MERIIDMMAEKWPSSIVCRKAVKEFSGGLLNGKTLANADSKGTGPEGRFLLMNQVAYPVESLCAWLKQRASKSWSSRKTAAA